VSTAARNGPRVLVKEKIGEPGVVLLRRHFDVDLGVDWSDDELGERIGGYEGILIRSATKLDAALIERAKRLRVIGRAGVGVDNVDVAAATKHGIVVANAPQSNVVTAAEHTMALLLALARNIPQADASLRAGRWDRSKFSGIELYDKTLGIVGFGRIGQAVARRAEGFGMEVLHTARSGGVALEELLERSDFVTLHCPLTEETRHLIDAAALDRMKPTALLVNTARGPIVDPAALERALYEREIAGAALDVTEPEPLPPEHPLLRAPNLLVVPHVGSATVRTRHRMTEIAVANLLAALAGDPMPHQAN
jgi:D-3-phosphoglycerate dehydrogenase